MSDLLASAEDRGGWYVRLVDARFSAEEATEWERLVADGMDRDEATETLISHRRDAAVYAFTDALLALEELGHQDVSACLRDRWPEVPTKTAAA